MNVKALDHSLEFVKSWLAFRYQNEDIPGYTVTVAYKGKILLNESYGYANLEKKLKLTPEHIFRIASHSKTFTATALMRLQEKGKLRIDDYVSDHLSWLKEHKDKRWHKVTIRQLMSHGAGVIRDGKDGDYWQLERPFPDKKHFIQDILDTELVIDNNLKLKYSNYGYSVLGLLIEAVSGKSYNSYVTDNIVKPLGLKNTGPEYSSSIRSKTVTGYTRKDTSTRLPIDQVDTKAMSSATGFYSTGEDLCTYFNAQMVGSKKLLSDESKKEMQRVQWHAKGTDDHVDYGLGMEIEYVGDRTLIGHGGGFPGQITNSLFDPKDELVVIVLTNCLGGPSGWISRSIYSVIDYFQTNTPSTKPKHDFMKLEGRYMNLWSVNNIVVTGDKVVATYPDTWWPLTSPQKLTHVDGHSFKLEDADSFGSDSELVRFNLSNGKVYTINYADTTMWPEEAWLRKQRRLKSISLDK